MQALPPPGSRVAFYSRYSTSLQNYSSIEGQERINKAFADQQGWIETGRYSDAERSGTTTLGRDGLFQMLAAAERQEFDVLLVEDLDRTSRNAADMHRIAEDLEALDIVFCTVANGVVTDMELAFKAVQNQQFIKQNVAKSKRGQEQAVVSGRMSGSITYGYRKVIAHDARGEPINGLREIDPDKAAIINRIHQDFDAGKTTFEICRALNAEGVPGARGKLWRPGALLGNRHGSIGILRNPMYIGEYQFRKTSRKRRKGQTKTRFTSAAERIIVQHPKLAIVDKALWDRNQARLAASYDKPFHTKRKVRYLFTGKVVCGECGQSCLVTDGKFVCTGRQQKGVCDNSRRVPRLAVERTVVQKIRETMRGADLIGPCLEAYREEVAHARSEYEARTAGASTRLKEIDQTISNLMVQLGAATEASYVSQAIQAKIEQLGAEKRRIEREVAAAPVAPSLDLSTEAVLARIDNTLDNLQQALGGEDREAARATEVIQRLVDRLVLKPTPGTLTDGRGAGDMTVTVEGPLAALIDLADLDIDRVAKNGHRPTFILDNASSVFSFCYVLEWADPRLDAVRADLPAILRLLDTADAPVSMNAIMDALDEDDLIQGRDVEQPLRLRARNAVAHLQSHGYVRHVGKGRHGFGYVSCLRGLSDEDWKARVQTPPMTQTIPSISLSAPEATPVVIGRRKSS